MSLTIPHEHGDESSLMTVPDPGYRGSGFFHQIQDASKEMHCRKFFWMKKILTRIGFSVSGVKHYRTDLTARLLESGLSGIHLPPIRLRLFGPGKSDIIR